MNNKQYNNVIEKTAKLSETDMNDSLALTRDTLNNMGVPLPQGELKEVSEILSTNDYMYWRACSAEDAQAFANEGIAASAVSDSNIAILTAETDNPTTTRTVSATETANVSTVSEVSYYAYSSGGTNTTTYPDTTESGDYYCNNKQYGKYLRTLCDVITVSSGTLSELKDSIVWRIDKQDDGYYTIKINGTSKYLSTNGTAVRLTVVSDVIPAECKWIRSINREGGGVFWENACHQKFLACNSSGLTMKTSVGEIGTATYYSCVWRIVSTSAYGNTSEYQYRELDSSFSIPNLKIAVGKPSSATITASPFNALWITPRDFTYSFDSDKISISEGKITGYKKGTISVVATHKVTNLKTAFIITVSALLIYRTRNREEKGFLQPSDDNDITPIIAEDYLYATKSKEEMYSNGSFVSSEDLYRNIDTKIPVQTHINVFRNFCSTRAGEDPADKAIILEMADHFVSGERTTYTNDVLSNRVREHEHTVKYCEQVEAAIKYLISQDNGISKLYYDEELWIHPTIRKQHPLVKQMKEESIFEPYYNEKSGDDLLTIAIDSWYGNKIEVEDFEINGSTYNGTLRFTFYDHFGLDTSDLAVKKIIYEPLDMGVYLGTLKGFRTWYVLQHWDDLGATIQPKPFVTQVSFTKTFNGTFNK